MIDQSITDFELAPHERLLWSGTPNADLRLREEDIVIIPFSLMWGGFAIVWEGGVLAQDAPLILKLWGIPFVLLGMYLTVGRFFVDAKRRSHTRYGITNERIIIISGIFRRSTRSIELSSISETSFTSRRDEQGTIWLGPRYRWYHHHQSLSLPEAPYQTPPRLEFIPNVQSVHQLIRDAQRQRQDK